MGCNHSFEWPSIVVKVDEKISSAILLPMIDCTNKKTTMRGGLKA